MKLRAPAKEWSLHFGEGHEEYLFRCPGGCGEHRIVVRWGATAKNMDGSPKTQPVWEFNGSLEQPTFQPSLLVKFGSGLTEVCHSYIRDGQIQFLPDCTHALAGKTVPLPDVE